MDLQNIITTFKKSIHSLLSIRGNNPQVKYVDPKERLAFIISRVLGPIPLILILWFISTLRSSSEGETTFWVYSLILFLTILVPLSITTYLLATKKVPDIEWKNIEDRKKYLFPIAIPSLITLIILTYFLTDKTTFHLILLLTSIVFTMGAVWQFFNFKISGHIVVATIAVATIILFYGFEYVWLFLLIPVIMWARYTLKVHTVAELIAGFLLPLSYMLLALLIFGWPGT